MKRLLFAALTIASIAMIATDAAAEDPHPPQAPPSRPLSPEDLRGTVPALADYGEKVLFGDLWKRTELSPRDRSLVTLSALVAGGHDEQLPFHIDRALDNGVTESEIREVVTHLAFYAGWPNAMSATRVLRDALEQRGDKKAAR